MKRRSYTTEFKEQVVREADEIGNAKQVAKRYDISAQLIYKWRKRMESAAWQQADGGAKRVNAYAPTAKEFETIEQENLQLKQILGDKDLEIAILRDLVKKVNPAYQKKWK
jgi:transposase